MRDEGRSNIEGVVVYIREFSCFLSIDYSLIYFCLDPDCNEYVHYKTNVMKSKTFAECNQQKYEESTGHCSPLLNMELLMFKTNNTTL